MHHFSYKLHSLFNLSLTEFVISFMIFFLLSLFYFISNMLSKNGKWVQKREIFRNLILASVMTIFVFLQTLVFLMKSPEISGIFVRLLFSVIPLFFLFQMFVISQYLKAVFINKLKVVFFIYTGLSLIFTITALFTNLIFAPGEFIVFTPLFYTVYPIVLVCNLIVAGVFLFLLLRSKLSQNKSISLIISFTGLFILSIIDVLVITGTLSFRFMNFSLLANVLISFSLTVAILIEYYQYQDSVRTQESTLSLILDKLKSVIHNGKSTVDDLLTGSTDFKNLSILIQKNSRDNEKSIDSTINYTNNEKMHIKNFSTMVISNINTFENILSTMMVQNKKVEDFSVIFTKVVEIIEDISSKGRIVSSGVVNLSSVIKEAKERAIDNFNIINEIQAHIRTIQTVNKTIDKISDDANVLAMNAAIESANNIAFGSGFMVVAEDLKKLSVRTKTETSQIEQILNHLIRDLSLGISAAQSVMHFFEKLEGTIDNVFNYIINIVDHTKTLMDEIEKSKESLTSLVEITSSIAELGVQQKDLNNELNESIIEVKFMIESIRRAMDNQKELIQKSFQFSEFISECSGVNDQYTYELSNVFNQIQHEIIQTTESKSDLKLVE
ncbi:MAG: hypothetical protein A2Y33_15405 [Spirochaetes bacterium GWF1_51_8]|nr:MAG: hypothetical protein A2Y33_15405 [Spirochaetes bacterium GWF1_51_8]